jgi:hypothetical protein
MGELTSIGSSNHCSLKVGSGSGGNNTGSFGVAIAGRGGGGGGGGGSATQKSQLSSVDHIRQLWKPTVSIFPGYLMTS